MRGMQRCVEARGQLVGVGLFLPPYGSRAQIQVFRLGDQHLFPLSYPMVPYCCF